MMETRYIARARVAKDCKVTKARAGDMVTLQFDPGGGGWHEWARSEHGKLFKTEEEARRAAVHCAGPYYNMPDPASIEILAGDYTEPVPASFSLRAPTPG